jgi:predicted dehydrogenase
VPRPPGNREPMAHSPLQIGVIGVGSHGRNHARIYASLSDVRLAAVVDSNRDRAEQVAKQYGTVAETDYRRLLGKVDAVSVVVPTIHHHAIGMEFLESGVDVLMEKPIAATTAEADALIAAAGKGRRTLMVGHTERFNPAVAALAGVALNPRFIEVHRLGVFPERSTDIDVILDVMIHDLDVLLHLTPSAPRRIDAVGVPVLTEKLDIANARIHFQNGCIANLTASRVSMERVRKVRIFQPDSYVSLDYAKQELMVYTVSRKSGQKPGIARKSIAVVEEEPLKIELQAFVASVRSRTPPPVTGDDGKRALALAVGILESIHANLAAYGVAGC